MKKIILYSAVLAMIFATAVMATSCQKEKEKEENTEKAVSHFNPANLQIDDMNAYLEGFKEKMENAEAKGSTETMDLDEAAWHLSSVANHDFANIGASHDTLRFDTLYCHIDVTDGMVSVADMNAAYEEMSQAIVKFKKGLGCDNPNFWFIDTEISENGDVVIPLTTMFIKDGSKNWGDHYWYLNPFMADSICAIYINPDSTYYADNTAIDLLEYILTLRNTTIAPTLPAGYMINENDVVFYYQNYIDPYGSPYAWNSRLYASNNTYHSPIYYDNMCYLFDSYAGLIESNVNPGINYLPTSVSIEFLRADYPPGNKWQCMGSHEMTVHYGQIVMNGQDPGGGGFD